MREGQRSSFDTIPIGTMTAMRRLRCWLEVTTRYVLAVCLAMSLLPAVLAALNTVGAKQHSSNSPPRSYYKLRSTRSVPQAFQLGTRVSKGRAHRHHEEEAFPRARSAHRIRSRCADDPCRWGSSRTFSKENVLLLPTGTHRCHCRYSQQHAVASDWTEQSRRHCAWRQHRVDARGAVRRGVSSIGSVYGDFAAAAAWRCLGGGFMARRVGFATHEHSTGGCGGSRSAIPTHVSSR